MIGKNNEWVAIGGMHLLIWKLNEIKRFEEGEFKWFHEMRLLNPHTLQLLTDPWHKHSAIWELDLETHNFNKIRPFPDYKEKPLVDKVVW